MPEIAAFIDAVRAAFCETQAARDALDATMRAGVSGVANRFHAREGDLVVGTPFAWAAQFQVVQDRRWERGWRGE